MKNTFNKVVVIGDVHGNPNWKLIVDNNPDANLFVFVGDYVSTHEDYTENQQLDNLIEILEFKENNPERVILLRGNHDLQHLGYYWAECSGFFPGVQKEMMKPELKDRYLRDTHWVIVLDDICISHAGVTQRWLMDAGLENIEDINTLEPSELFGFRPCKMSDYYGISQTQGPTWIRPGTLVDYAVPGYRYIVGHTTMKHPLNYTEALKQNYPDDNYDNAAEVWDCDCRLNGYIVIENNEIRTEKLVKND